MATGIVVSFDEQRGFGFIRTPDLDGDVFVHVREVQGRCPLRIGQRVRFEVEATERGPRAVRVEPGRVGLAPSIAALLVLAVGLASATLVLHVGPGWGWAGSWVAAINPLTFGAFAWDKRRALRGGRRIPERALLALSLAGGSPAAALAMPLLRHKTRKPPFLLAFAAVLVVQALGLAVWVWPR